MLKGCVIGLGYMGRHHLRNLVRLAREGLPIEIVGAADIDPNKEALAREYDVRFYRDFRELVRREKPDFATVAVPTELHLELALELSSSGIHFMMEKPIAESLESAYRIYDAIRDDGVKVMVGHIERFNPAVMRVKEMVDAGELGEIISLSTMRVGLPRLLNIDVVDDLATHDIDIVKYLSGAAIREAYAIGLKKLDYSIGWDQADITLLLDSGGYGRVTVGRLSPVKIRRLSMFCSERMVEVDLLNQEVYTYRGILDRRYTGSWKDFKEFLRHFKTKRVKVHVHKEEPLYIELKMFINYLLDGGASPVPVEDAIDVLRIIRSIKYVN